MFTVRTPARPSRISKFIVASYYVLCPKPRIVVKRIIAITRVVLIVLPAFKVRDVFSWRWLWFRLWFRLWLRFWLRFWVGVGVTVAVAVAVTVAVAVGITGLSSKLPWVNPRWQYRRRWRRPWLPHIDTEVIMRASNAFYH